MSAEPESSKLSEKEGKKHVCLQNALFPNGNISIFISLQKVSK